MHWNVEPLASIVTQLLLILPMVSCLTHHQMPINTASHIRQNHNSLPKRHISSAASGNHPTSFSNSQYANPSRSKYSSGNNHYNTGQYSIPPSHQHTSSTTSHHTSHSGQYSILQSQHSISPKEHQLNTNTQDSSPSSGHHSISTASTTVKPLVSQREQEILTLYHSTIAQVTQISSKIAEINQHLLNHSLDVVAVNVMRFDQYIADVDSKTKDCKYNSEAQVQRIKVLLQQKLKTNIAHCMSRVNNRLYIFDQSIKDELNKYNNVILLQVKNILIICNKMQGNVMQLCLDKSWQICTHINDKFLSNVNGFFNHALLVYNQSNDLLVDCLQKDVQVNKKYFHWAIKLFRTANCKNLLNS